MVDRYKLLPGIPKISQCSDQLRGVHFVGRRTCEYVLHWDEASRNISTDEKTAAFLWITGPGMVDDLIQ